MGLGLGEPIPKWPKIGIIAAPQTVDADWPLSVVIFHSTVLVLTRGFPNF